jgi:hypothetical protein
VIQISTPITNQEEGAHIGPLKNTGPQKKEPLGVFAKILAGLLRNSHKSPAGINGKTEAAEIPGEVSAETSGEIFDEISGEIFGEGGGKIPSRKRKKSPPLQGERETPAFLSVSPEQNPLPAGLTLLKTPGEAALNRTPLTKEKAPQKSAPPPAEGSSPGDPRGEAAPRLSETLTAGIPAGETEAPGDRIETLRAGEAEKTEALRDRKSGAVKEGPWTAVDFTQESPGASETLPASWKGIKEPSPEKPEKEGNRVAEGRSRDRRRERLGLEIRDFRTMPPEAAPEIKPRVFGNSETGTLDLSVELSSAEEPGGERGGPGTDGPGGSFERLLARELRQDLAGDIVRGAQVVLRDGGEGTIRLSLKPESLGTVKIRLEMAENKITGHIIVENSEALKAFEGEIRSLEQAFLDSGFDGADLDTALASEGGRQGEGRNGGEGERDSFFSRRLAAVTYEANPEWGGAAVAEENFGYGISRQINMLI